MNRVISVALGIILILVSVAASSQTPDPHGPWVGWPWVAGLALGVLFIVTSKFVSFIQANWQSTMQRLGTIEGRIASIDKDHYDSKDVDEKFDQLLRLVEKLGEEQKKQAESLGVIREKMIKLAPHWGTD